MSSKPNSSSQPASGTAPVGLKKGDEIELAIDRMAHGGEGIATAPDDGRVVFVAGAYPGDRVRVTLTQVKKNFARGEVTEVLEAGPLRVESSCPAAAQGAGCCDFATLAPDAELELKAEVLMGQLRKQAGLEDLPDPRLIELQPARGWRTRVRLGVDEAGRAGLRKRASHDLVTDVACTQLVAGLVDGLVGPGARSFTPGAEVIVVMDAEGQRHVIESRKGTRGKRVEKIDDIIEGTAQVVERVSGVEFRFPATAFWQAHSAAPETYSDLVKEWLLPGAALRGGAEVAAPMVAWDLYGGVGAFVPALSSALSGGAEQAPLTIYSVDYSPAATAAEQQGLANIDVEVIKNHVEKVAAQLPHPEAVVLDPPRTGAGAVVVGAVANAAPAQVIHVGCDPATFARDLASWAEWGYRAAKLAVINAFPGTHHVEAVALLEPVSAPAE